MTPRNDLLPDGYPTSDHSSVKDVAKFFHLILCSSPNQATATEKLDVEFEAKATTETPKKLASLYESLPPPDLTKIQDNYDYLAVATTEDALYLWSKYPPTASSLLWWSSTRTMSHVSTV